MNFNVKIKVCGLSRLEDIEIVNENKPDYIGFVFAESRRKVTPEQAFQLREKLDPAITSVGVFVDEPIADIISLVKNGVIDMIQLHGNEDEETIHKLKIQTGKRMIKANRISEAADYLLFDSPNPGSGNTFDWGEIPEVSKPFFLAGGLNPANVAEAVGKVKPFAVDVSSGVETSGIKDLAKMKAFIRACSKNF